MARRKDCTWNVPDGFAGRIPSVEQAQLAVLMDIRDELKRINTRLDCHETLQIPHLLRRIATNTTKRKYTRRKPQ